MPWRNIRSFLYTPVSVCRNAPAAPGVYAIFTPSEWVYIGESLDIQARLLQHLNGDIPCISRSRASSFSFELLAAPKLGARHRELVLEYLPFCNP